MATGDPRRALEGVFKLESARLVAGLMHLVRDIGVAEELAQDALVCALERWPASGVPDNPGAWLMATAKHRALDLLRRRTLHERKRAQIVQHVSSLSQAPGPEAQLDDPVGDDLLRLIFVACHPALAGDARVALTLRLLGGLTTAEIARAFLVTEATIAQRIVRAKRTLARRHVPFEVPRGPELGARLASVLEVIYLVFNEGYAATSGDDWMRPALCDEALRLAQVVADLMPREPEVQGLLALMEIQASRMAARVDPSGAPVLLLEQDRDRWDALRIERGLGALARAEALGGTQGMYALQAAIAACHARARVASDTDWVRVAALYDRLALVAPSPVVELNRAMAIAMAHGPAAGLQHADGLESEPVLARYPFLPAVRGDLLLKLGRDVEARLEFERAAALTSNARERALLLARAASAADQPRRRGLDVPNA